MPTKQEIDEMAKSTIDQMIAETPELSELPESAKGAMQ